MKIGRVEKATALSIFTFTPSHRIESIPSLARHTIYRAIDGTMHHAVLPHIEHPLYWTLHIVREWNHEKCPTSALSRGDLAGKKKAIQFT